MGFVTATEAAAYDAWYAKPLGHWVDVQEKQALLTLLPPVAGLRLLDAGCGSGNFTLMLAAQGAQVVGTDRSPAMLGRARQKVPNGPGNIIWIQGDLLALPLASGSFDGVTSILALDFVAAKDKVVQELTRVLKPGGFLILAVLNRLSLWALHRRLGQAKKPVWRGAKFLSPRQLRQLLAASGTLREIKIAGAVYNLPWKHPWGLKLAPLLEAWGHRLVPWAAAFVAIAARKQS